jgi:hypothetical protein
MTLRGRPLRQGELTPWNVGHELALNEQVAIVLQPSSGTDSESSAWDWTQNDTNDVLHVADEQQVRSAIRETNSTTKLALCGFCLAIAIAIVLDMLNRDAKTGAMPSALAGLVRDLSMRGREPSAMRTRNTLQEAYYFQLRGDRDQAIDRYAHIRDEFLASKYIPGDIRSDLDSRIYDFVKQQLQVLRPTPDGGIAF